MAANQQPPSTPPCCENRDAVRRPLSVHCKSCKATIDSMRRAAKVAHKEEELALILAQGPGTLRKAIAEFERQTGTRRAHEH